MATAITANNTARMARATNPMFCLLSNRSLSDILPAQLPEIIIHLCRHHYWLFGIFGLPCLHLQQSGQARGQAKGFIMAIPTELIFLIRNPPRFLVKSIPTAFV